MYLPGIPRAIFLRKSTPCFRPPHLSLEHWFPPTLLFLPEVLFDSSLLCLMPCVSPMTLRIFLRKFPTSTPV